MSCYFCKKRVWSWQESFSGYHLKCYRTYLYTLLDEMPPEIFSPFDISQEFAKSYRETLLKEMRVLNRFIPGLNLEIAADRTPSGNPARTKP